MSAWPGSVGTKASVSELLRQFVTAGYGDESGKILSYLPDFPIDLAGIRALMINEVVADSPANDFYAQSADADYPRSTLTLFRQAGVAVDDVGGILDRGIYITSAVKAPKTGTAIPTADIKRHLPILKRELGLFPSLKAVMMMGDVAKKAVNMIAKEESGKNAVPAVSTYKLRHDEILYGGMRLFPAYIMTGLNLAIEKSKMRMSAEEVAKMLEWIG